MKLFWDEGLILYLSGLDSGLKMSNSSIKESSNLTGQKKNIMQKCHLTDKKDKKDLFSIRNAK